MTLGRDVDIVSAYGCLERGTNREITNSFRCKQSEKDIDKQ